MGDGCQLSVRVYIYVALGAREHALHSSKNGRQLS